ncbi:MAG: Rrf2 family transcriptional regulator [Oscillospiraceae bacterium]|nr:Rrf2 family transcriptional regulator [Oscillospiraceae bacterium]
MYLTKECDYGIRVIRALATGNKKTVKEICGSELIPKQFGYKILKKLEHAGFLRSIRGCDGGYQLIKPPDTFTIFDIVSAVDQSLFITDCLRKDNDCNFKSRAQVCAVHLEFERIQKELSTELKRYTIAELMS